MSFVILDVTRVKNLYSGLGQYALHLGKAILEVLPPDLVPSLYLHPEDVIEFGPVNCNVRHTKFWQKELFRNLIYHVPCTSNPTKPRGLWHTFDQLSSYGPVDRRLPVIYTIHDLNFPDRSEAAKQRGLRVVQKRIDRASVIVTISEYSADQIRTLLDTSSKEIRIIPSGHCLDLSLVPQQPTPAPRSRFLFSIGEFRSTKNFHLLIPMVEQIPDYELVIAGNLETEYGKKVLDIAKNSSARSRIRLPGKISDSERRWYYENCSAFLFPSIAEGFGLPVIEAMSCGRPVFTTQAMSLPEVAGPLAFYWQDLSPKPMANFFLDGITEYESELDYAQKLKLHAAQFNWQKTAQAFVKLYSEIL